MYRKYRERRHRRRTERRPRSLMMRPGVQIAIILVAALIVFLLLQSGGR
jgi:hypothetical protein